MYLQTRFWVPDSRGPLPYVQKGRYTTTFETGSRPLYFTGNPVFQIPEVMVSANSASTHASAMAATTSRHASSRRSIIGLT